MKTKWLYQKGKTTTHSIEENDQSRLNSSSQDRFNDLRSSIRQMNGENS